MKITKKELKPIIVLGVIFLVAVVVLAGINAFTHTVIEENERKAITNSLKDVMDGEFGDPSQIPDGAPDTVKQIYAEQNGKGHVVIIEKQGYANVIKMAIGISTEKKTTGVKIISQQETHGKDISPLISALGKGADASGVESADIVSGATKTSGYIKAGVYDAFVALGYATPKTESEFDNGGIVETTDDEVIAIAKELMDGEYEKISVEGLPTTIKGVYKNSKGGHAIHIATRTEWRPVETEGVVTVDRSGRVTGVKMLQWIVGYDQSILDSAPECDEEFLNSIIGKTASSLNRVELVSHATNTSNNFVDALTAALEILYPTKTYTIIGIVSLVVALGGTVAYIIVKRRKGI